jgi:hypothetical protein
MEQSTKQGYVAGLICLLGTIIFGIIVLNTGLGTIGGKLILAFSLVFGVLSALSLVKPDSVGIVAWEFLQQIGDQNDSTESNQEVNIYGDNFGNASNTANESDSEQAFDLTGDDTDK